MKTIFLAAGRSTRMEPLRDKNLLQFCGEPLLIKLLKNAASGGLTNFVVVAGPHNRKQVESLLQKHDFDARVVTQSVPDEGMAGGVLAGLEACDASEPVVILGGNDAIDPTMYGELLKKIKSADGAILAQKVTEYFPGGYLQLDGKKITGIVEKPGEGNEPSDLVTIVAHAFASAEKLTNELQNIDRLKSGDAYEQVLQQLFAAQNFVTVEYYGSWQAVKFPHHVLDMSEYWLEKLPKENFIHPSAQVADTARIRGEQVYIDEGVRIFDNAVICGPCYIGKNSIVGNNALVRNSTISENCEVGFSSEIARSFLAEKVSAHHAYVGDSVIDTGVNFGAFSCTANLRLDHRSVKITIKDDRVSTGRKKFGAVVAEGTQIGIHAMLMPGCKTTPNSVIRPGEFYQ